MSDPYEQLPEASYLYNRAEQELSQAQQATHPAAVKAHYLLAGYYLDRVYGAEDLPPPPMEHDVPATDGGGCPAIG